MSSYELMLSAVRSAKNDAKFAERTYDDRASIIEEQSKSNINLFGGTATRQVVDIASAVREACDDLYVSYQSLIKSLDMECRPLLDQNPSTRAVCEVTELIKWLNSESKIGSNFTASLNGSNLGDVASIKYIPSLENQMIQKFWESKLASMPGALTEQREYRERQLAERKAEREAERRAKKEQELWEQREKERLENERLARQAKHAAETEDRRKYIQPARLLVAGSPFAFAYVKPDGSMKLAYKSKLQYSDIDRYLPMFTGLKSVALCHNTVVGLRKNGTCIVGYGSAPTDSAFSSVNRWTNIEKLAAGTDHVVGLRKNGTCVSTPVSYGNYNETVASWTNIQDVCCGSKFTIGLKTDGTVVYTGDYPIGDYEKWTDIVSIDAEFNRVIAVTKQGRILTAGNIDCEKMKTAENIVQVAVAYGHGYALQADGKVLGGNPDSYKKIVEEGVVAMAGGEGLLMLKEDGKTAYDDAGVAYHTPYLSVAFDRLFDSYAGYLADLKAAIEAEQKKLHQQKAWRDAGVCQYCGAAFKKSLFSCKCSQCGKKKDY